MGSRVKIVTNGFKDAVKANIRIHALAHSIKGKLHRLNSPHLSVLNFQLKVTILLPWRVRDGGE